MGNWDIGRVELRIADCGFGILRLLALRPDRSLINPQSAIPNPQYPIIHEEASASKGGRSVSVLQRDCDSGFSNGPNPCEDRGHSARRQYRMQLALMILVPVLVAPVAAGAPRTATVRNPTLRKELLHRVEVDQKARLALIGWSKKNGNNGAGRLPAAKKAEYAKLAAAVRKIDTDNTKWLRGIVKQHGWPGKSLVGKDGAKSAWLLVQHADADRTFQRKCLDLIAKLPTGEVEPQHLALLTDRVLLAEGKKQIYGTQFLIKDGKLVPRPIEDAAGVDRRRKAVGLPPLAEYVKLLEKTYLRP
jgi:Family of unknown function (DUF6624)